MKPKSLSTIKTLALEEEFFSRHNAELVGQLKQRMTRLKMKEQLAEVSGIADERILDVLLSHGVGATTFAAVSLIPLIQVAWADGILDAAEAKAILESAVEHGIEPNDEAHTLLSAWLKDKPQEKLYIAWREYIRELVAQLGVENAGYLREGIVGRAKKVAEATGGILGFGGKISAVEQKVLDSLVTAFS